MKLGSKLLLAFLVVGVVPFAVIAILSLFQASSALSEQAYDQLEAVREIKRAQVETYFKERLVDLSVLAGSDTIVGGLESFEKAFMAEESPDKGRWNFVEEQYSTWLKRYKEDYGYHDLFLIAKDGDVVYSVSKASDLGQNLITGSLRGSPLGKCFEKAMKAPSIQDFEPYELSNNEPCAFVATPVKKGEEAIGVLALQLRWDVLNKIMLTREGMGETGETYLVGSDKLMRSDSRHDPKSRSVKASFANPAEGKVETDATREALSGKEGEKLITNYRGKRVLSAYAPVKVGETTWALIAEIDEAEAFAAVKTLKWLIGLVAMGGIAAIIFVALLITRSITKPVNKVIDNLTDGAEHVTSASEQVSSASQSLAEGASEQASSLEQTSSSLEEMASMTRQNANNATQANQLMEEANQVVARANKSMGELTSSMEEISKASEETSKIIKTIDEIAFQTNLLALNAAVEAARAGESGAGFAVVADEVRNLAMRAADAAKNTAGLIEGTVKQIKEGSGLVSRTNQAFSEVATSSAKVGELVSEIAAASNEQAQGIDQVNRAVAEMDKIVQENAANAEEGASASEEMRGVVGELVAILGGSQKEKVGTMQYAVGREKEIGDRAVSTGPQLDIGSSARRSKEKELAPYSVIPLEEDDFKDF